MERRFQKKVRRPTEYGVQNEQVPREEDATSIGLGAYETAPETVEKKTASVDRLQCLFH